MAIGDGWLPGRFSRDEAISSDDPKVWRGRFGRVWAGAWAILRNFPVLDVAAASEWERASRPGPLPHAAEAAAPHFGGSPHSGGRRNTPAVLNTVVGIFAARR